MCTSPFLLHWQLFCFLLGIKAYSNWPTIPQVFIGGEFIGGCDIMLQMHQNGELVEELRKAGIKSALLDKRATDA
jgi:monothiol glutaredoxin